MAGLTNLGGVTPTWENKKFEILWVPYQFPYIFCHKDSRTVFVFILAQLESPPQKNFGFNGNFNAKMTKKIIRPKITSPGSKMVPKVSKWGF